MNISIPGVQLTSKPVRAAAPKFAPEKNDHHHREYRNDVDDMVVGGGSGGGYKEGPGSGRKVAKVEAHHLPSFDDNMGGAGMGSPAVGGKGHYDLDEDSDLPLMDRPIRPKASVYAEPQADIDDDPNGYRGGGNAAAGEQFPPGQHPLEGVPKCTDHVVPESFTGKSK